MDDELNAPEGMENDFNLDSFLSGNTSGDNEQDGTDLTGMFATETDSFEPVDSAENEIQSEDTGSSWLASEPATENENIAETEETVEPQNVDVPDEFAPATTDEGSENEISESSWLSSEPEAEPEIEPESETSIAESTEIPVDEGSAWIEPQPMSEPEITEEPTTDINYESEPAQFQNQFASDVVNETPEEDYSYDNSSNNFSQSSMAPAADINDTAMAGFARWYSGSRDEAAFEIDKNSLSAALQGDAEHQTIHINVGYDTYGWQVQFDDGTFMNLRDVREYQLRNGELPSSGGKIIYGTMQTEFSGIQKITIYESVRYFTYA